MASVTVTLEPSWIAPVNLIRWQAPGSCLKYHCTPRRATRFVIFLGSLAIPTATTRVLGLQLSATDASRLIRSLY